MTATRFASPKPLPPDRRRKPIAFAKAVGGYVPKLTAKAFEKYGFHSAEIMMEWPRVAGAELAAITAPERIRWPRTAARDENGATAGSRATAATLVLRVEPAHALDVEYRTAEIIDRLNRYFGYRAIADIKLLQAPLTTDTLDHRAPAEPAAPTEPQSPLPVAAEAAGDVAAALARLAGSVTASASARRAG